MDPDPVPAEHRVWDEHGERKAERRKKHSQDNCSLSSDMSCGSREESLSQASSTPGEDSWHPERKLSSSAKSQTDSGIGTEEPLLLGYNMLQSVSQATRNVTDLATVPNTQDLCSNQSSRNNSSVPQNNAKPVPLALRQNRVGVNVNDLNAGGDTVHADNCDVLTAEEQLAAMLNRHKLHARARSGGSWGGGEGHSFSIQMTDDRLVVLEGQVQENGAPGPASNILDRNLNTNDSKFDTSTASSSQSTDNDSPGIGTDGIRPTSDVFCSGTIGTLTPVSQPLSVIKDEVSSIRLQSNAAELVNIRVPHFLELPGITPPPPNTPVETPDVLATGQLSSGSSTTTSGPDSPPLTPATSDTEWDGSPLKGVEGGWSNQQEHPECEVESSRRDSHQSAQESPTSTSSSASASYNWTFPENSMTFSQGKRERRSARDQMCGVFSVDLGE